MPLTTASTLSSKEAPFGGGNTVEVTETAMTFVSVLPAWSVMVPEMEWLPTKEVLTTPRTPFEPAEHTAWPVHETPLTEYGGTPPETEIPPSIRLRTDCALFSTATQVVEETKGGVEGCLIRTARVPNRAGMAALVARTSKSPST